ncbi:hypothetical protein CDL15_Pgr017460 [Punica granatum]|uniref:Uncharacterized protein n=1 Tax=Punica granatum TaxID=22663 RepID=A0A218W5E9_PUNGR|nr:hypothetical protein CDL15_Pgr017460 [Punica granatum]
MHSVVLVDVLIYAKRRVRGVSEKLVLPRKVDRPSGQGSPCRGGRVKLAVGLPAKDVFNHLYGEMLVVMQNSK